MKIIVFISCCIIGLMVGYMHGVRWIEQYEVMGMAGVGDPRPIMKDGFYSPQGIFKIIVHPKLTPLYPILGEGYYSTTILELKEDGYWHAKVGNRKLKFKLMEETQ